MLSLMQLANVQTKNLMGLSMPLVLKIVTMIVAISLTMWFYPFFTILEGIVNPPPCQLPPLCD